VLQAVFQGALRPAKRATSLRMPCALQALPLLIFCAAAFPVVVYVMSRMSDLEVRQLYSPASTDPLSLTDAYDAGQVVSVDVVDDAGKSLGGAQRASPCCCCTRGSPSHPSGTVKPQSNSSESS